MEVTKSDYNLTKRCGLEVTKLDYNLTKRCGLEVSMCDHNIPETWLGGDNVGL